ncbi:unnamed protein product, partial [marine sediment metagenome]
TIVTIHPVARAMHLAYRDSNTYLMCWCVGIVPIVTGAAIIDTNGWVKAYQMLLKNNIPIQYYETT